MSAFGIKSVSLMNSLKKMSVPSQIYKRFNSSVVSKLVYSEYGDPMKVVHKENEELPQPKENEVLVKMLAAPVNPADVNTIQGKYPSKPPLPAVPGNEGVGKVIKIGPGVLDFEEGDHVVPLTSNLGTWRTHLTLSEENLLKVPKKLGLVEAATLTVNPCTAYRMLKDFTNLKPGDTVIQNGANSACGQNVIQICRSWGVRTVNIVRGRPEIEELRQFLKQLGATYVLTEEEIRSTEIFKTGKLEKPKLALNCVGGKSALEIMRLLQNGSPIVTYGGMSREPVTVPTSALIFKDIQVRGFWMTRWSKEKANSVERLEMFEELISMMTSNDLQGPAYKMVEFENYKEALMNTMTIKGMIGKKFILDFGK
ncbi:enoyl-[acyl-carrier-protein] reductase, mitochondrial-like [Anoplophora glabripennis]|uniref:enoyl-[acyl-carrier-protein] reductase, mitochondrial-like n=1 Tax=Anoplophora glabripennis TaxID=217634 RepID=UPI0008747896|nr:enoyl-[acyl-carrier-protein] reductase, mitochondrial-like [Anoplophora glabripennis]